LVCHTIFVVPEKNNISNNLFIPASDKMAEETKSYKRWFIYVLLTLCSFLYGMVSFEGLNLSNLPLYKNI